MKKLLLLLLLLSLSGCAGQSRTKQDFIQSLSQPSFVEAFAEKEPRVLTCFGPDKKATKEAIASAQKEAIAEISAYLPQIMSQRELEAYLLDWGNKIAINFFKLHSSNFTLANLSMSEAKECIKFQEENSVLMQAKAK